MSDPIADMLTRIRNAQMVEKPIVTMRSSKLKVAIAQVLKDEGCIDRFHVRTEGSKSELEIGLKYYAGRPVIERIERVSRPGLRIYKGSGGVTELAKGLGVSIVTKPKGAIGFRKSDQGRGFSTGQPASGSTKLPAETLNALSSALKKA